MKAARYSWIALLAVTAARAGDTPPTQVDPPSPPPKEEGAPDRQPGGPRGPGQRGEGRGDGFRKMMENWKKADTNNDTFISPEEFAAMERIAQLTQEKRDELFKRFDKNNDGKIGQDELRPRPNPNPNPNPDGGEGPHRKRLPELDLNGDGKIDFEEFKKDPFVNRLPEESQQNMFKRFDTDGDGFLTPQDRPQRGRDGRGGGGGRGRGGLLELIKDHDKDANGSLNFEEFRQIPWIAKEGEDEQERRFEEFDKNKDLKLDATDAPPPGEKPERPDKPDRPDKPKDGKKTDEN